jgi:hypothetical protein
MPKNIWVHFGGLWNGRCWYSFGHIAANWNIFMTIGKFSCYLVYFPRFGMFNQEKSGNPGLPRNT